MQTAIDILPANNPRQDLHNTVAAELGEGEVAKLGTDYMEMLPANTPRGNLECQCSNCKRLKFNPVRCSKGHLCDAEYCTTCSCILGKCVDHKPKERATE